MFHLQVDSEIQPPTTMHHPVPAIEDLFESPTIEIRAHVSHSACCAGRPRSTRRIDFYEERSDDHNIRRWHTY